MVHFNDYMLPDNYDKKVDCKYTDSDLRDHIIERKLGEGNFGTVFIARMRKDNKLVAIKKVLRDTGEAYIFRNEYQNFKKILHPYLIQYSGYFELQRYFNFVLEYAPNGTLERRMDDRIDSQNTWTETDIGKMTADVLLGLEYLHHHSFVRRDLKPDNIVIDSNDRLKLTDFGMAKYIDVSGYATLYASQFDAKCYAAPELLERREYDKSVDFWPLGVILYEMCTFWHPFLDKEPGTALPHIPNIYSNKLQSIILEMLEVDPAYRCHEGDLKIEDIIKVHYDAAIRGFNDYWARKVLNNADSSVEEEDY
ncbi:putative serine/threonine-protein kinase PRKY [Bradysia coprophila]|uniref:putative serine/threonine-protein kinase PRKY n=1 Tax=Bradysia coprophila TaxID=38358 RepID=UPI00187D7176|nr:putative serine/threonine-protein kinase PRKY [Bradysia coprophila]